MSSKRKKYRITHKPSALAQPIIVEGLATSPFNACKLAFKIMLKEGYIERAPLFNNNTEEFPNTEVEIVRDYEVPKQEE